QRAARLLELAGRRHGGLAQLCRHQKSGGRRADRAGDLRQGSRRARRRHQGARPRALVEFLRRAAGYLREEPQRALGPVQTAGSPAQIRRISLPDRMVVGRRKGREDRDTLMTYIRNVTRRDTLALGAGALAASLAAPASAEEEPERHGMSSFGELKYPANFKHFDYIN